MLRLNSLSASGMRYGRLRVKRLACSRASQPLEMALCAASCAVVAMSAIIVVFPFVFGFVFCCVWCALYVMWCGGVQLWGVVCGV
nr:MAG TPA: hypothetical protein [Caudoviricetes sp.]